MSSEAELKQLKEVSDKHKMALQADLSNALEESKRLIMKILIIGGGLALALVIVRAVLKQKEPGKSDNSANRYAQIRNFVLTGVTTFLLSLAKEKLIEYLQQTDAAHVNTEDIK